jgi:lipopolysaccharide export system protein LptC
MAEIHVHAKKQNTNTSWVWIVLLLVIAAAVVYFLTRNKDNADEQNQVNPPNTSSYIQPAASVWQVA